jgi:glycine/D-amino acid oxidase-like deaminating enzyme
LRRPNRRPRPSTAGRASSSARSARPSASASRTSSSTAAEIAHRWPALQPRGDERGYFEPEAGLLRPEACVQAQLDAAVRDGATLRLDETVRRIDVVAGRPSVVTDRGTLSASSLRAPGCRPCSRRPRPHASKCGAK